MDIERMQRLTQKYEDDEGAEDLRTPVKIKGIVKRSECAICRVRDFSVGTRPQIERAYDSVVRMTGAKIQYSYGRG